MRRRLSIAYLCCLDLAAQLQFLLGAVIFRQSKSTEVWNCGGDSSPSSPHTVLSSVALLIDFRLRGWQAPIFFNKSIGKASPLPPSKFLLHVLRRLPLMWSWAVSLPPTT